MQIRFKPVWRRWIGEGRKEEAEPTSYEIRLGPGLFWMLLKISLTAVSLTDLKIIRENQKLSSHKSPRIAGEWQSTREIGILLATCSLGPCCCFSITSECFELSVPIPRNKIVFLLRCACLMGGIITMPGYFLMGNTRGPHSFSVYLCPHEPRASREQPGSGQVVGWGGHWH